MGREEMLREAFERALPAGPGATIFTVEGVSYEADLAIYGGVVHLVVLDEYRHSVRLKAVNRSEVFSPSALRSTASFKLARQHLEEIREIALGAMGERDLTVGEVRALHNHRIGARREYCGHCQEDWPCDTVRLADMLTVAETERARYQEGLKVIAEATTIADATPDVRRFARSVLETTT